MDEESDSQQKLVSELEKEPSSVIDISETRARYVMLIFAVFLCFGSYFVYDNPSALQTQLQDKLGINSVEYNLFYSVYSFPNFVLPLFGGYFIDSIGVRKAILIFGSLVVAGQCIFAFGVDITSYPVAVVGRVVFGLGGESLNVGQSAIVSNWFAGKDIALALGLNISISRLGSVVNDLVEPPLDRATGSPDFGLWLGAVVCGFSLLCGVALIFIDRRRSKLLKEDQAQGLDEADKVKLSDIRLFTKTYWLITVNCLVVYVCVMSFNNIATNYFQVRFGFSKVNSGIAITVTYSIAALFCPFLGIIVDRIGKRTIWILTSAILVTAVHLVFLLLPDCDNCPWGVLNLCFLGIAYSIYSAVMWASIPFVVPGRTVGTAFGVTTAIQNIGLGIGPLVVGAVHDGTTKDHGYFYVTLFFVAMGILGVVTAVLILIIDKAQGGILMSSDPRLLLQNNLNEVVPIEEVEPDLPEVVKEWKSDPAAQAGVRASMSKVALHHN